MKKEVFLTIFAIFLISLVSAEIIINQQPNEVYVLGDRIIFPITITTSTGIYDFLQISLICDGKEQKFPVEEIDLAANEAKKIEKSIFLIKKFIGGLKGNCKIKAYFEGSPSYYIFSNEFKISNTINISIEENSKEFNPEESIGIKGIAKKENGNDVNGFLEVTVLMNNQSDAKTYYEIVNNGFFSLNFSMPKGAKSDQYLLKVSVYDKDPLGETANNGFTNYNIFIKQVPTSLEIVFDNNEANPGENLMVKSVLHDQTGEKIDSKSIMTIKNSNNKILEQKEVANDEFFEFQIPHNELPSNWTIVSLSNKLTTNSPFTIKEKESAEIDIINRTVIVTNNGNVPYNETLLVKIGNSSASIDAYLKVDEVKKYTITAPDGTYDVEISSQGEVRATRSLVLTGNSIDIRELSASELIKSPIVFIFITLVFGFMVFMVFKKGYKKSFFGYIPNVFKRSKGESNDSTLKVKEEFLENVDSETIMNPKNKAEISLSLQGNKQNASIICLKVKNSNSISKRDDSTNKLFEKIRDIVMGSKGFIYESQGSFFFLFIPSITKTFKNERKAVEIAEQISKELLDHNRVFKQKVDFGISVDFGDIVTKKDPHSLKFMAFGNLMNVAKKIASLANSEVYLSDTLGRRILTEIKADKLTVQGVEVYKVKELRRKNEEHERFIRQFMKRIEGDEKKV